MKQSIGFRLGTYLENHWTSRIYRTLDGKIVERYTIKQRNCAYRATQMSSILVGYLVNFTETLGINIRRSNFRSGLEAILGCIYYSAYQIFTNGTFIDLDSTGLLAILDEMEAELRNA